jgi:hypothetical protein
MTERVRQRPTIAALADVLTAGRVPLAVAIAAAIGLGDALVAGALLLCVAWVTDFLDGRLARRSGGETRLGDWDAKVDAAVGIGVTLGLVGARRAGVFPWLVLVLVLLVAFWVTGNLSLGMVLQAIAYGLLIVELAQDAPEVLWVMGATVGLIGVADGRRFAEVVLPTFFGGLGLGRGPQEPGSR